MTTEPIEVGALLESRERLLSRVAAWLGEPSCAFLWSVENEQPEFGLIGLVHAAELPGVRRKLHNLAQRTADKRAAEPIPSYDTAPQRISKLDPQALFLSFNYTSTLNTVYDVDPQHVLFIHGCAAQPGETLVLGHAWNPSSRRSLNDRHDIEEIDTRLMEVNDIIDDYFSATFKHSAEIIVQHASFFQSLAPVEQVVVLGHSLSDVDAVYFQALLAQSRVAQARWVIAVRNMEEWPDKQLLLAELGVPLGKAMPVLWQEL